MIVYEWDDLGCDHVISDMCQSHDCRDQLLKLKEIHPDFKCTMFAIPGEMTLELMTWCEANSDWVELAVHGFFHSSNYECEKMSYEQFDLMMDSHIIDTDLFKKIFRAPGWQISDDGLQWLADNDWIIADQGYNDERRPKSARAYVNYDGNFKVYDGKGQYEVEAYHGHTWDVGWNGIYEDFEKVAGLVSEAKEFKFVSELFND